MRPSELHDHEAEAACLGACFVDPETWETVATLTTADFHLEAHALVFQAIQSLRGRFDHLTLAERMKAQGALAKVGGPVFLMGLDAAVPMAGNVAAYVASVRAMSLRRAAYRRAQELAEAACNLGREATDVVLEASAHLANLGANGADSIMTGLDVVERLRLHLDKVQRGEIQPTIPTGLKAWDYVLGGLQPGTVTMLGGRPGLGKTAVETSIALHLAHAYRDAPADGNGGKVGAGRTGIVWLEDPVEALARRGVAYTSTVPVWRIAKEVLTGQALVDVGQGLVDLADLIGDAWRVKEASGLNVRQLDAVLRQMVVRHGCRVLIIDHLGEIEVDGSPFRGARDLMTREVVKTVRNVAKDLNVAVLLLLHLARSGSKDKDQRAQRPTLESGGESSAIEKMARAMVYLWDDPERPGFIACHVPKQTEGEKGFDFYLRMHKSAALVHASGGMVPEGVRGFTDGEGLDIIPKRENAA
jgi:replicative DNA helicase